LCLGLAQSHCVSIVADSSTSTGLAYREDYAAGKNKIINGDFGVWQRGTSFTNPSASYTADRFICGIFDGSGATRTISRQSFTPGTAPVSGYESSFFFRYAKSVAGSGGSYEVFGQRIEDVRTFAGQTITISFWAKADSAVNLSTLLQQNFGSGGSSEINNTSPTFAITTSWARYSVVVSLASISGKTIGTNNYLFLGINVPLNVTIELDTWGWQLEAGSTATSFQTATGTIQGELAACQRYFISFGGSANTSPQPAASTTAINRLTFSMPVSMRAIPSASYTGTPQVYDNVTLTNINGIGAPVGGAPLNNIGLGVTVASGLTQFRPYYLFMNNGTINFSSEL
jgi:hypothetical protein